MKMRKNFLSNPILQHADKLLESDFFGKISPILLLLLVSLLKEMDNFVKRCFGTGKISENLSQYLQLLKKIFQVTDLSQALKIHILEHIEQCLQELNYPNQEHHSQCIYIMQKCMAEKSVRELK